MTTTPVMTITDEQIAEIELDIAFQAALKPGQCEGGVVVRGEICRECGATAQDSCRRPLPKSYAVPSNITALISRLRAAEKDASRWRKCKTMNVAWWPKAVSEAGRCGGRSLDQAIDDAMEESE